MTQDLTAASPTYWAATAQEKLFNSIIMRSITDFSLESLVKGNGRIIDKPYMSDVVAEKYTKGTAVTAQDVTATSDQLTIDQFWTVLVYVDEIDQMQNKYNTVNLYASEIGRRLGIIADAEILFKGAYNATTTIDNSNLGGTSGDGISLAATNVDDVFGEVNEALDTYNVSLEERFMTPTPLMRRKLWERVAGKESAFGDRTAEFGNIGTYAGLSLYLTNNTTVSARWTPANQPSDADTITIEGITFTFETGTLDAAGKVKSETSTAVTLDHLVAFINAGGATVSGSGYELSAANQRTVQKWYAYDGTTYVVVYVKGDTAITVTGSDATDTWDAKYQHQHILAGHKRAIAAAIQTDPMVDVKMASTVSAGTRGTNVMPLLSFGSTVFNNYKARLVNIKIRTDS